MKNGSRRDDKYKQFDSIVESYLLESFCELTRSNDSRIRGGHLDSKASYVSKVKVEAGEDLHIYFKIYFEQDPRITIEGASEQSSTADVCAEVGNWVAGRARSDLQSLGIRSKQINFLPMPVTGDADEIVADDAYSSNIVLEGAGVTLQCSVTVLTKDRTRLENWPQQSFSDESFGELEIV